MVLRPRFKLKYIGVGAFEGNRLHHVVIPESVQMIHRYAFRDNGGDMYDECGDFNTNNVKILNSKMQII